MVPSLTRPRGRTVDLPRLEIVLTATSARRSAASAALLAIAVTVAGCAPSDQQPAAPSVAPAPAAPPTAAVPPADPSASPPPTAPEAAPLGTVPPPWLGTRVLPRVATGFGEVRRTPPALRERRFTLPDRLPPLPGDGFAARVADPAPARVIRRSTWEPACPVAADELAWVRATFRGFDGERHTGELLVGSAYAEDVVDVLRALWDADFPLEEMRITTRAELDLPPTGDGNNTGAFVCRPVRGATTWSEHAYGRAIDINPFQNPYVRDTDAGRVVLPELASAYLDRDRDAPGMVTADGPVVAAFRAIGWGWGGDFRALKDWQHFSSTGR